MSNKNTQRIRNSEPKLEKNLKFFTIIAIFTIQIVFLCLKES